MDKKKSIIHALLSANSCLWVDYHERVNDLQYYLKEYNINKTLIHMIAGKHEKELTRLNVLSTLLPDDTSIVSYK